MHHDSEGSVILQQACLFACSCANAPRRVRAQALKARAPIEIQAVQSQLPPQPCSQCRLLCSSYLCLCLCVRFLLHHCASTWDCMPHNCNSFLEAPAKSSRLFPETRIVSSCQLRTHGSQCNPLPLPRGWSKWYAGLALATVPSSGFPCLSLCLMCAVACL